jgi:hypothetical protein
MVIQKSQLDLTLESLMIWIASMLLVLGFALAFIGRHLKNVRACASKSCCSNYCTFTSTMNADETDSGYVTYSRTICIDETNDGNPSK